jgi:serine/threonine-protein kinase RsbW
MMPLAIPGGKRDSKLDLETGPAVVAHIPSDPAEARSVQEEIERALKAHHYAEPEIFGIRLAVEEALVNAIKHGNALNPSKKVRIAYHVRAEHFEIVVADEGPGFDPEEVPDPTAPENLERCCGRGLMLMRHYMSEVAYNRRGNSVRMRKLRKKS